MRHSRHAIIKWLTPGLQIKRWLALLMFGITVLAIGFAQVIVTVYRNSRPTRNLCTSIMLHFLPVWARVLVAAVVGLGAIIIALYELNRSILAPFALRQRESWIDMVYAHSRRQRGPKSGGDWRRNRAAQRAARPQSLYQQHHGYCHGGR